MSGSYRACASEVWRAALTLMRAFFGGYFAATPLGILIAALKTRSRERPKR